MAKVKKPAKMTKEVVKKLEDAFALDCSIPEACLYANITKQTYYNWIASFPEMKDRFDSLRQRPFLKARQTIFNSLNNPDYAFKYMERKKKDEFSLRTELTGSEGKDLIIRPINYADTSQFHPEILPDESIESNG